MAGATGEPAERTDKGGRGGVGERHFRGGGGSARRGAGRRLPQLLGDGLLQGGGRRDHAAWHSESEGKGKKWTDVEPPAEGVGR